MRKTHYDIIDKNNTVSSEDLDRHYHKNHRSSYRTRWDISNNVCLDLQYCSYSIFHHHNWFHCKWTELYLFVFIVMLPGTSIIYKYNKTCLNRTSSGTIINIKCKNLILQQCQKLGLNLIFLTLFYHNSSCTFSSVLSDILSSIFLACIRANSLWLKSIVYHIARAQRWPLTTALTPWSSAALKPTILPHLGLRDTYKN